MAFGSSNWLRMRVRFLTIFQRRMTPYRLTSERWLAYQRGIQLFRLLLQKTALATSVATVPDFGFGIKPRGPSKRAYYQALACTVELRPKCRSSILPYPIGLGILRRQ